MIGRHLLIDFFGVDPVMLTDRQTLSRCLTDAARAAGLTPVSEPALHEFEGGGITGFVLLSESHIALHSYPELKFLAFDIFTCGKSDPGSAVDVFRKILRPEKECVTSSVRGHEPD